MSKDSANKKVNNHHKIIPMWQQEQQQNLEARQRADRGKKNEGKRICGPAHQRTDFNLGDLGDK
jgi:hypothetical protein